MSAKRMNKSDFINAIVEFDANEIREELEAMTVKELRVKAKEDGVFDQPASTEEEGEGTIPADAISDAKADRIMAEGTEKFAYVQDKDPSPKQEFYAAMISALTGVEVTPKQYQAFITTHRYIQASDLNRARRDYRPRTAASVLQAAATLQQRADEMLIDDQGAVISKSATHIPEELAQRILSQITPEMEPIPGEEVDVLQGA
ncbi:hypothetical protein SEA_LITTLEFELLA_41 [Gordonia phage LittleFella]|nr:hypothetical protein SEA_LITTLEFELLA_41 [Gordonia phage LittleFella]